MVRRRRCSRVSPPTAWRRDGQRLRKLVEAVHADDLLDHVRLARHVVVAEVRRLDRERRRCSTRRRTRAGSRIAADCSVSIRSPSRRSTRSCRSVIRVRLGSFRRDVDRARHHARAAELDHQPRREPLRPKRQLRMELLLEARARLRAQAELLRRLEDVAARSRSPPPSRPCVVLADTSLAAPPMMPPMPDAAFGVADEHRVVVEHVLLAVERHEPLALTRAANVQRRPGQPIEVVGVHRLAERQHHVVGDVDDVVDRPLARRDQARLQPQRRGPDRRRR